MEIKYPVSPCILDRPGAQAQVGDFFIPSVEPQGSIFFAQNHREISLLELTPGAKIKSKQERNQ